MEIHPQLDGSDLVFIGGESRTSLTGDVYSANLDRGTLTRITSDGRIGSNPDVSDGRVVWSYFDGDRSNVYTSSVAAPKPESVPSTVSGVGGVRIDGDRLFWNGAAPGSAPDSTFDHIYSYNLTSGQGTVRVSGGAGRWDLSVQDNRIVWTGPGTPNGFYPGPFDVFALDLESGKFSRVTSDGLSSDAEVSGDLIVYTKWVVATANYEIYTYRFSDNRESRLTTNQHADFGAKVFGTRIAWVAQPEFRSQVFLTDLALDLTVAVTDEDTSVGHISMSDRYLAWEDYGPTGDTGVRIMVGEVIVEHYPLRYLSFGLALAGGAVVMTMSIWRRRKPGAE